MTLNFILGKAGSGKTAHILQEMITKEIEGKSSIVFLVPEQYSLQAEKDILSRKTATAINVLSFKRLAYRVFAETGLKHKTMLDDVAMAMLLRKVLTDINLQYYNKTKITPGFIEKLSQTITELTQNGITTESLLPIKTHQTNLAKKTADIYDIYSTFLSYTADNFISTDQALDILATKIAQSSFLADSVIYIDGFSSLTAQEYNVISQLLTCARNITITITTNIASVSPTLQETDLFYEPKITLTKMVQLAAKSNIPTAHIYLESSKNITEPAGLAENLFSYNYKYNNKTENITLTPHTSSYQEVSAIAAKILHTHHSGETFSNMAIVAPPSYHLAFQSVFADYGIPFFLDKTTDIMAHPLTNTILSAIGVVAYNWQQESIFAFLKAGLTNIPANHIDIIENYALAYNIKGYKWKLDKWVYPKADEIQPIKEQVLATLTPFEQCFKHKTVKDTVTALFNTMEQMDIFKNLLNEPKQIKENTVVYNKLIHVLDIMVEFIGEAYLSPKEFLNVLESGLAASTMGKVPEMLNCVTIADISRSRLPNIKTLFVAGTQEMRPTKTETLYTDTERALINSFGVALPVANANLFKDNFALYSYFSKPTHYLHISYATNNYEGKTIAAAPIVSILKNKEISPIDPAPALSIVTTIGKQKEPALTKETVGLLYDKNIHSSVSRLEQYARCPFSYFATYNLQARPRPVFEMNPMDIGEMFHRILEGFTQQTMGRDFSKMSKDEIVKTVGSISKEIATEKRHLFESYRDRYTLKRLERIATTSIWVLCQHLAAGQFQLYGTEIDFSQTHSLMGIIIEIDGYHKFVLRGRLDRIDIFQTNGNTYVKIIDYKSGNKKFNIEDVYDGIQLQLIVYLQTIIQQGEKYLGIESKTGSKTEKKVLPGGVFYFKIDDPILPIEKENDFLKTFEMSGLALKDPEIINAMQGATPVRINKDGTIRESNYTADLEEFNEIMKNSERVIKEIGQKIVAGYISPDPFKKANEIACTHCNHKAICGYIAAKGGNIHDIPKEDF
ncbi:MAG: PD-(D/E)XK nuclease family protein [Defluviitaleaceae bacterium]|nr:PD-(D/E)XK nuclease family protein [Defluviitaleaceae bacterium]